MWLVTLLQFVLQNQSFACTRNSRGSHHFVCCHLPTLSNSAHQFWTLCHHHNLNPNWPLLSYQNPQSSAVTQSLSEPTIKSDHSVLIRTHNQEWSLSPYQNPQSRVITQSLSEPTIKCGHSVLIRTHNQVWSLSPYQNPQSSAVTQSLSEPTIKSGHSVLIRTHNQVWSLSPLSPNQVWSLSPRNQGWPFKSCSLLKVKGGHCPYQD